MLGLGPIVLGLVERVANLVVSILKLAGRFVGHLSAQFSFETFFVLSESRELF
jgi:hypothetical protein